MWSRTEYLSKLGLSFDQETIGHVNRAECFFSDFAGGPFDVMFIGTMLDEDGVPRYGSLWFFTETHVCFSPNFRSDQEVNYLVNLRGVVKDCNLELTDCDLGALSGDARMSVMWSTTTNQAFNMNAHGENCRQLYDIARRFLIPGAEVDQ